MPMLLGDKGEDDESFPASHQPQYSAEAHADGTGGKVETSAASTRRDCSAVSLTSSSCDGCCSTCSSCNDAEILPHQDRRGAAVSLHEIMADSNMANSDDIPQLPPALEAGVHPSIAAPPPAHQSAVTSSSSASISAAPSSSSSSSRTRSTSRGRTGGGGGGGSGMPMNNDNNNNSSKPSKSPLAPGQTLALPRSGGPSSIPLPSPSAVHINQSLEDSLRRGEEERLRRSAERRERRRRRIQQSKQSQARKTSAASSSAPGSVSGGGGKAASLATIPGTPSVDERGELLLLEDDDNEEASQSIDSTVSQGDGDSALVITPTIPMPSPAATITGAEQASISPPKTASTTPLYTPQPTSTADEDRGSGSGDEQEYFDEGDEDYDSEFEEEEEEDEGDDGRSLTRQLAETAVSVREMSRELGRARVKSNIQSVLIVTKARDNQLIKLTREVALYLMKTPRYGRGRGLVVYVDSQLKKSKRFDAAGIERDNPELFRSPHSMHHHHHHHHSHSHSHSHSGHTHPQGTVSGGTTPRRNSSRRTSSNSTSSLNLLGMTAASTSSINSSSTTDRGYFSNPSGYSSGASTPAQTQGGKPMTKLTEALVSRQIDRQLEKENARRMSMSQTQTQNQGQAQVNGVDSSSSKLGNQKVAFAAGTASVDGGSTSSQQQNGDEQHRLLRYWTAEMCSKSPHLFDLVVTLGGDGTVLFTSWLFQHVVPPVIPFALGSLGFLTNFDFSNYKEVLETAINEGVRVNLRMRFTATIYRAVNDEEEMADANGRTRVVRSGETGQLFMESTKNGAWENIEGGHVKSGAAGAAGPCAKDKEVRCSVTRPVESFEVLNDLVVDRGPSPYVSLLELFGDEHHMTTVQADGLCVATPTGSTAYSLSAGGSLVHPEIPTLLITPICPHTLSFRPMLLPDSMELRIVVPYNSRSTAWASFDGRGRVELRQGDHIKVTASTYPFPTVCADKQSTDWFQAITRTLKWNERQRQKSFVVLEHDRMEPHDAAQSKAKAEKGYAVQPTSSRIDASVKITATADDDDDEGFDIDDISSDPSPTAGTRGTTEQSPGSSIKPADKDGAHNERQSGPPTIRPPGRHAPRQNSSEEMPTSPNEHDYSHSSAQHLRQYATYPKDSYGGGRSPRDRTPRTSENKTPTARDWASNATLSSRTRAGSKKSTRFQVNNDDHVKAFVVFGADSSDVDTSASEDGSG